MSFLRYKLLVTNSIMIDNKAPTAVAKGNTLRKVKDPRVGIASEYAIMHKIVVNNQAKTFRTNIFTPSHSITYKMLRKRLLKMEHRYLILAPVCGRFLTLVFVLYLSL